MTTDTSERGLERLICTALTGLPCDPTPEYEVGERPAAYGAGWTCGNPRDYDREYCVDLVQLSAFLRDTQLRVSEVLGLEKDGPTRRKFLARLQGEISRRGTIDVLRHGIKHGAHHLDLFYGTPSPDNLKSQARYAANRFSVTRQLRYSRDETQLALDLGLFINGLPVATFELKNSLTKQTVEDAVEQYKRDRDPREKLFEFGRCVVHFGVDDHEVRFCTHLKGKASWFLPFNQGWNDGAGNPPNPNGLKTDYLWKRQLTRGGLTNILENYAQVVETRDEKTGRKSKAQIWPRYHQLDVVRRLLADIRQHGAGKRYLIQHSAGSGKSNSIAWLAHQLIGLRKDDAEVFDSIIVVTDRRLLDTQIRDTIRQFAQVGAAVGHAARSGDLRRFIESGKKIIISTVQKFPFILDEIGNEHRGRRFAMVIDEAHSSQGGRTAAAAHMALSEAGAEGEDETTEDAINRIMVARKFLPNASYFAFTATPKNKTLEIFGEAYGAGEQTRHRPFHSYTMKQAIQEGFILDVLRYYTPVESYYKLIKKVEGDPEFDTKRARKKLRRYVESQEHAIQLKAEIMVRPLPRTGGWGSARLAGRRVRWWSPAASNERSSTTTRSRLYLLERRSPVPGPRRLLWRARVRRGDGHRGIPPWLPLRADRQQDPAGPVSVPHLRREIPDGVRPSRCCTRCTWTRSCPGSRRSRPCQRLNRAHPKKHNVFFLDFLNDTDTIEEAFADYYRDDDPRRGDGPQQAARPQGRAR